MQREGGEEVHGDEHAQEEEEGTEDGEGVVTLTERRGEFGKTRGGGAFGWETGGDGEERDEEEDEHEEGDGAHGPGEVRAEGDFADHDGHDHAAEAWGVLVIVTREGVEGVEGRTEGWWYRSRRR